MTPGDAPVPTILRMSLDAISGLGEFLDGLSVDTEVVRIRQFPTAEDMVAVIGDAQWDWQTEQLLSRLAARAALRDRMDIVVVRLEGEAYRQWLDGRANTPELQADYLQTRTQVLAGSAALRALGLPLETAKPLGKLKPAVGGSLAARLARWVVSQDASLDELPGLAEELLQKRQDGALRILEGMVEPEDFGFIAREIDDVAAQAGIATPDGMRPGFVFLIPAVKAGKVAPAPVPATLASRLARLPLGDVFGQIALAPFVIETGAILSLTPSQLRQVATALASGQAPPVAPAHGSAREVSLLGIAAGQGHDGHLETGRGWEEFGARLQAWREAIEEETGLVTEEPVFLSRARDILRRVELAIPDEGMDGDGADDALEADQAAVVALAQYVASAGNGRAAVVFEGGAFETYRITDGLISADEAPPLEEALDEALSSGGRLLVFGQGDGGGLVLTGYDLAGNVVRPMSSAEAREVASDYAAHLGGTTMVAADAPVLEYDPSV